MRWPLSAVLLAVTIVASAFGVFTAFWDASHPNHALLLGAFLLIVCVSTVGAMYGTTSMRCAFVGASLFGAAYLIFVLHGGFGLETIHDSNWLARNTKMGFALLGISFLASHLLQIIACQSSQSQGTNIADGQSHKLEHANEPASDRTSSRHAQ